MEKPAKISNQRHIMVRIFGYCINKLWLLLASTIILVALIHIALGLLLPTIDRYKPEISEWLKVNYDLTVDMASLSAEWDIQGPSITLKDFQIKSKDGVYNLLSVKQVSVEVDLLASILDQRISTQDITIDGADIQFFISSELGFLLSDDSEKQSLKNIGLENISQELFDALFGQRRLKLINSNLSLFTLAGTEFKYLIDELEISKFGTVHQLFGKLSYAGGGDVTLISEVYGDPTKPNSYSEVYLEGSQIDIARLPLFNLQPKFKPKFGELSWQFWGTWKNKHWESAKALLNLDNATLGDQVKQGSHLQTMVSWEHQNLHQGFMAIHNLQIEIDSNEYNVPDSFVNFSRSKKREIEWDLYIHDLGIQSLTKYIAGVFGPEQEISKMLNETQLDASIDQLHLALYKTKNIWQPIELGINFSRLEANHWNGIPQFKDLSGSISYSNSVGLGKIKASDTVLLFPSLFRHALEVDSLSATVRWLVDTGDNLRVEVEQVNLANKDFKLFSKGAFFYLDQTPVLNLYTELQQVVAANKSLYLPVGVMSNELVSYLDTSIKSGTLSIVKSILRGPMDKFPFDSLDGTFVAYGELVDASYQYLPDWPIANGLDAKLLFEGSMMDITSSAGVSLNNRVNGARAFVKDLSKEHAILKLDLDVSSFDNSGRNFLKETPLNSIYQSISEIDYIGKLRSKLELAIDLDDPDKLKLNGKVLFGSTKSELKTSVINVQNVLGELRFNEQGITESHLKVDYLDNKLELVLQGAKNQQEPILSIDVKGVIASAGISHFIGDRWLPFFNGRSEFTSLIQFSPNDKPSATRILFQSDFKGMAIDFPGMFGKNAGVVSETFLSLDVDDLSTGEIKFGNISGDWYWKQSDNTGITDAETTSSGELSDEYGGDFFINQKSQSDLKQRPGLRAQGQLDEVLLSDWLSFIAVLQGHNGQASSTTELFIEKIDLQVNKLIAEITEVKDLQVELTKLKSQPWDIKVISEQLVGNLKLNEYSPWQANVQKANLTILESSPSTEELASKSSVISPLDFNDLDLKCSQCVFNQVDYGELQAEVRRLPNGVTIIGQMKKSPQHQISLSGAWFEIDESLQETQLRIDLQSANIGDFLKQWEIDATVEDSSGQIQASAWWTGAPWEMDYTSLDGDFQLALGKGYLSEISDQQGRLFSLFNLQSILRKLTFDFKDVYKKGFFYDTIDGTIQIRDGIVSSENIEIEGNVADVKVFGQTDLKNEKIDQTAVITPHLTSSFPVLAAWAVEPTTGLLVFLLDKIMEPAVEVATRLEYSISGSFDEVVVEEIKRSKKKIKVEYASEADDEIEPVEPESSTKEEQKPIEPVEPSN